MKNFKDKLIWLYSDKNSLLDKLKLMFNAYYQIVKLPTVFRAQNIWTISVIALCGLMANFLSEELFIELLEYPYALNTVIVISMYYAIFLKFNLLNRFTYSKFKGGNYFLSEIKNVKSFTVFIFHNIAMGYFSLILVIRIYTFLGYCNSSAIYPLFIFNLLLSIVFYNVYNYFVYNEIDYSKLDQRNLTFKN